MSAWRRLLGIAALTTACVLPPPLPASGLGAVPPPAKPALEEPAAPRISPETTPEADRAIEHRLQQIFSEIEGADEVRVSVRSGVVVLTGAVLSPNAREQAVKLARQVEGVVDVLDKTTLVRDVRRQVTPAFQRLRERVSDLLGYLPLLALALVTFLGFWFLASLLERWDGLYRRLGPSALTADLLRRLVKLAVLALGLVVVFDLLGATALVSTVLGAAGIVGLVLGFALRETVENYIAAILLSTRQPFARGDLVDIEGQEGQVLRMTSRATLLMTADGNHVRIPNARVLKGLIINYTRNPERAFHFDVGVSAGSDLAAAQRLAATTLVDMDGVLDDPPAHVDVHALGAFNVTLRVFGWVDQRHYEFLTVRSEAIRLVKEAFDAAGIVMPAPVYDVRMQDPAPPRPRGTAGPRVPIDIGRRDDIQREADLDRRVSAEPDLLRADAPLE